MITGYNTDTRHSGVVYHVQTEDGGKDNPVVVTLVYRGGRILASKKTAYAELLDQPDLVNQVRALLEKQHRMMLAAVNAGMLAEGGKLEAKAAESLRRDGFSPPAAPPTAPPTAAPAAPPTAAPAAPPTAAPAAAPRTPAPAPAKAAPPAPRTAPPVEPPLRPATHDEKSLDQVILEFLASELGKK